MSTPDRSAYVAVPKGAGGLACHPGKEVTILEYNGYLEKLETLLYQRVEELLRERRYAEAEQVMALMGKVGIV